MLKFGLTCGVLIFAVGFANVSGKADPIAIVTLLGPYRVELLVSGIVISAISGAGILLLKRFP
jgi:uncharacterized membrane protein (DUF441 family)